MTKTNSEWECTITNISINDTARLRPYQNSLASKEKKQQHSGKNPGDKMADIQNQQINSLINIWSPQVQRLISSD